LIIKIGLGYHSIDRVNNARYPLKVILCNISLTSVHYDVS